MLHTKRFLEIVDTLSERFDRIIFDSPPVGPVSDAVVLSTVVDGTLIVLKAGQTTFEVARRAVDSLLGVKASISGAVLNDLELENREYSTTILRAGLLRR